MALEHLHQDSNVIGIRDRMPINLDKIAENIPDRGPIELKMRKVLSRIKDSKYPDSFNWSIYDKIAARYGDHQPRGGVVFNTGLKLVNYHSSCSKCHYAFEIDTYGRGCVHNCNYCYAKDILTKHGYWNAPQPFPLNMSEVRKIFYTIFETDKKSKWREIMEQKTPLRVGSMSDSFMWMDRKYKVTQELLKILKFYRYPNIVFTRSDLIAHDDYVELMDRNLTSIQLSICGTNEKITKTIEPGAPSVARRLRALKKLNEEGFWTTVRLNPLFPVYPDGYFSDEAGILERFGSYDNVPTFELFEWDMIEKLKEAKVPSLLVGFVRLSPAAVRAISRDVGIDFASFFKPEFFSKTSDSRYSDKEIATYYRKIKARCDKHNIRFNTCYIGNGIKDYFQYQDLWSNKSDCCDARGFVKGIKNSGQSIPWEIRLKHSPCKEEAMNARLEETMADRKSKEENPIWH